MKASEALKKNKKVVGWECFMDRYAMKDGHGVLYWYQRNNDRQITPISLHTILNVNWQPFDEAARPENVGELWQSPSGAQFLTSMDIDGLWLVALHAKHKVDNTESFVDWKCLFPVPQDNKFDIGIVYPNKINGAGRMTYSVSVPDEILKASARHDKIKMHLEVLK